MILKLLKNYWILQVNTVLKGDYTDFVSNPQDYPKSGIGAANIGPEFTMVEYDALA